MKRWGLWGEEVGLWVEEVGFVGWRGGVVG